MNRPGILQAILIAPKKGAPMVSLPEVEAVSGRGLRGDHHFASESATPANNNVTLIEAEKIASFVEATSLDFTAQDSRRNLLTQGIELNPLLGQTFRVGNVTLQAIELCEPCSLLARRTHRAVLWGLLHRGGLRCRIITGGMLRVGDAVS